jgi:outer membrane protein OmpA-like peptidoglycan-associated protein
MNAPTSFKSLAAGLRLTALAGALILAGCAAPPPPPPPPPPPAYTGPVLQIEQTDRGVLLVLPSTVLFEVNQSSFREASARPYLDRLADLVTRKSKKRLAIEGHTDADGPASLNEALSKARAAAVADAMITRGVARERIDIAGYSFNRPVASNATDEGKRLNRRVEMIVLDETVANITGGEPPGAFESAFARLKQLVESGQVRPAEAVKP